MNVLSKRVSKKDPARTTTSRTSTVEALTAMADELRGLCAVVIRIARRDHQQLLDRHQTGLSALEHGVLRRVTQGAQTLAEASALMSVAASTLVYVIDRLVAKGLLAKKNDPRDRRRERLSLTRKGASLLASIPTMDAHSAIVQSLASMNARERTGLHRSLRAFVAGLEGANHWQPEVRPATLAPARAGPLGCRKCPTRTPSLRD
jgi:DNA-binding MarR family transcriptional regulator